MMKIGKHLLNEIRECGFLLFLFSFVRQNVNEMIQIWFGATQCLIIFYQYFIPFLIFYQKVKFSKFISIIYVIIIYPSDRLDRIYAFTDRLFSLQSTYDSKLHNYEFLMYISNVNIIHTYYEASFYMPCKILNIMLV